MPSAVLNNQTFFKYWAFKAFSKSNKELTYMARLRVQTAAIFFGIITLGIGTAICRICLYDRKIINVSKKDFQKARIEKIFNGSNTRKKVEALNSTPCKLDQEEYYNLIKDTKTDLCKLLKNEHIWSTFSHYIATREMCDLLNQNSIDNKEKILSLRNEYISVGYESFSILYSYCNFELLVLHTLRSDLPFQNGFISFLSTLDFPQFREKYDCIKKIALQEKVENPLFTIPGDSQKSRTLAFACEVLDALASNEIERDRKMQAINGTIRPIQTEEQHLLWKILALHCEVKDISFLISYRFRFENEEQIITNHFFENLVKSTKDKWKASLPHVWDQHDHFRLNQYRFTSKGEADSIVTEVAKTLTSKKKFQYAFQSIGDHAIFLHKETVIKKNLFQYTNPLVPLLTLSERIQCIRTIVWPKDVDYKVVMEPHEEFFGSTYSSLYMLLEELYKKNPSPTAFPANEVLKLPNDILRFIFKKLSSSDITAFLLASKTHYQQLSPFLGGQAKTGILQVINDCKLLNKNLSEMEKLENLFRDKSFAAGALIRLKDLLEIVVFDSLMSGKNLEFPCLTLS